MNQSSSVLHVNGINLHVLTAGPPEGELVILLHGFPEFSFSWEKQINFLAGQGYFVIAPDQRGYGKSSCPDSVKAYSIDLLAKDVIELIKFFQRETAVIIGHDWGGVVGWYLASRYPEHVKKLIVLNVPHPAVFMKKFPFYPPQWLRSTYIFLFQWPGFAEKWLAHNHYKILKKGMAATSQPGTFTNEMMTRYEKAWDSSAPLTGMLNWYRAALWTKPLWQVPPPSPAVPVRIIWGKKDATLSFTFAKASLNRSPDGQLILLDEATHWLYHENPALVNKWLLRFLKEKNELNVSKE